MRGKKGNYDVKQEVTDKFSLRGRVFHKIREDILNGKYKENEELMYILSKSLTDDKKNVLADLLEKNPENRLALFANERSSRT